MKLYTFLIGSADDFQDLEALLDYFESISRDEEEATPMRNASFYEFQAPAECDEETVTMIGRGIAFSNDWCMDGTFSCVIEGILVKPTLDESVSFYKGVDHESA